MGWWRALVRWLTGEPARAAEERRSRGAEERSTSPPAPSPQPGRGDNSPLPAPHDGDRLQAEESRAQPGLSRALAGGRLTVDADALTFGGAAVALVAPDDWENDWRALKLDAKTLDRLSPTRLMEALANLSPDVSRALWDFLRLCNPGWEVLVTRPGSDAADARGQAVVEAFLARLDDQYGAVDVVFGRLFMGPFLRGALLAELVLDEAGREALDLATPDPGGVRYRRRRDPARGTVWELGQWQAGQFVALDRPTIRYVPIDPFPGSPYGRPMAAPALFTTLFGLALLHDLRRVVQQQGYPRLDLAIILEKLVAAMPPAIKADPTRYKTWIGDVVKEVQAVYADLEPDDAYVHTDVVQVNRPVGTVDADSLGAIDGLVRALERMAVRALKTAPFMMGVDEATTETQANRQWEAHLQSIKSLQHYAETLLERLLGLVVQAQGIQAEVTFRFAENRAAEMLRDEQVRQFQIANTTSEYLMGWISQEEAASKAVGHAPDQPAPRALPRSVVPDGSAGGAAEGDEAVAGEAVEPGEEREQNGHASEQTTDLLARVSAVWIGREP